MRRASAPFVVAVSCCDDCPLHHDDDRNGMWCAHPLADGVVLKRSDKMPAKCPLRRQHLTVSKAEAT